MKAKNGYKSIPLSFNRRAVHASASVTKQKNTIHSISEVDITEPFHGRFHPVEFNPFLLIFLST